MSEQIQVQTKIQISDALTKEDLRDVNRLIYRAWAHEQIIAGDVTMRVQAEEIPINDITSSEEVHVLAIIDGQLAAYGRAVIVRSVRDNAITVQLAHELPFIPQQLPFGYLCRLVVAPEFRGRGLTHLIDEERLAALRAHGVTKVWSCAVGRQRQTSLAKLGFLEVQPVVNFSTPWYETTRSVAFMQLADTTSLQNV